MRLLTCRKHGWCRTRLITVRHTFWCRASHPEKWVISVVPDVFPPHTRTNLTPSPQRHDCKTVLVKLSVLWICDLVLSTVLFMSSSCPWNRNHEFIHWHSLTFFAIPIMHVFRCLSTNFTSHHMITKDHWLNKESVTACDHQSFSRCYIIQWQPTSRTQVTLFSIEAVGTTLELCNWAHLKH